MDGWQAGQGVKTQVWPGTGFLWRYKYRPPWVANHKNPVPTSHLHHNYYSSHTNPAILIRRWEERVQSEGLDSRLVPFGHGDGGGGPTRDHLEYLRRCRDLEGMPRTTMASPVDYFRREEARACRWPVYVGELYLATYRGTYTTQARTKRGNRQAEIALREAEMWAAAATFMLFVEAYAWVFMALAQVDPEAFTAPAKFAHEQRTWVELLFLSGTNFSATGLGDILPVTPEARMLVVIEQWNGVIYLAMVVARLAGLLKSRPG